MGGLTCLVERWNERRNDELKASSGDGLCQCRYCGDSSLVGDRLATMMRTVCLLGSGSTVLLRGSCVGDGVGDGVGDVVLLRLSVKVRRLSLIGETGNNNVGSFVSSFQDAMRLSSLMVGIEDSSLVRERMGCLVEAFSGKRELLSGQQVLLAGDSQQQYYL